MRSLAAGGVIGAGAMQKIGQKLADNVERRGCAKGDAGVLRDIIDTLPATRPPDTRDRAGADHPTHARDRKALIAIEMTRSKRAEEGVSSPPPESVAA